MSAVSFPRPARHSISRRELLALLASGGLAASLPGCNFIAGRASDLALADAISQADMVANGHLTAGELVEAAIGRIEAINPLINAVITKNYAPARARAKNNETGRLWGVPYLIKDLTSYPGLRFTRGTRIFLDAPADNWFSPYIQRSEGEGLVVVGKTNTPEFGLISTTESVALGPCRNPWNLDYSTAGSSGGAGAAVAARLVPIAQASDGGGSIRLPAANCGLVGLKPTRGRFGKQYNENPPPPIELSIAHPLTWSVRDCALMLALTEVQNNRDLPPVGFHRSNTGRRYRIALGLRDSEGNLPDGEVIKAVEKTARLLGERGHEVVEQEFSPFAEDPETIELFMLYWGFGAAQVKQFIGQLAPGREEELLERWTLDLANLYESRPDRRAAVGEAIRRLEVAGAKTREFLSQWDCWLSPTTGTPAPKIGHQDPMLPFDVLYPRVSRYANYTPLHNVAGTPAISLPMHWTPEGIPVGVQIAAGLGQEAKLLDLAYQLEEMENWGDRLPPVHG